VQDFDYTAPQSLSEALELLAARPGGARVLAGGTDLIAQLKYGAASAELLVDVKRIAELREIRAVRGGLRIGAAALLADVAAHPDVTGRYPMLAEAASLVGSLQTQNRATLGGNVCNAAPSADCPPALICLGAQALIAGAKGERAVPLEEFFTGPGETVLGPGEILAALSLPAPPARSAGCYQRHTTRAEMDIAVAGAGAWVRLSENGGSIEDARIVLSAVAPAPLRAVRTEALLRGADAANPDMDAVAQAAGEEARPISDVRSSDEYRTHLVGVLVRRTVREALRRAAEGKGGQI